MIIGQPISMRNSKVATPSFLRCLDGVCVFGDGKRGVGRRGISRKYPNLRNPGSATVRLMKNPAKKHM